jgi:enoyl-CoA hydratase/carnithine racemase
MSTQLDIQDNNAVRVISWTRPEALNAMSIDMWHGTRDALDSVDADGIRCVVFTGSGRAFTVGQDLSEFADPRHAEPDGGFRGLMRAISEVPVPMVAAVNGMAVGFGFTLLPWCEVALLSTEARFKAPFVGLGVTTEAAASISLATVMGAQAATWHLLTGEWLSAEDALAHGLATRIVPAEELLTTALAVAERLATQPPNAMRTTTRLIREGRRVGWDEALNKEYAEMALLAGAAENIAAIGSFFERG